jgi:cytochrome d ubiquinol oxidase subunit II
MFLVLVALILRPVAFKFRSKMEAPRWRQTWDWVLCIGGIVPALIFGVAFGNLLQGVPFHHDADLRPIYEAGFPALLNPFGLLCGLVSVGMLVSHGAAFAAMKTTGPVAERSRSYGAIAAVVTVILFALGGLAVAWWVPGYTITSVIDTAGPSNPTYKTVTSATGAWLLGYGERPWSIAAPALGIVCPLIGALLMRAKRDLPAFLFSALGVAGIVATPGLAMFPFIMPSSSTPNASLTVWDPAADRARLHRLGLSRPARQGGPSARRPQQAVLLRGEQTMWYFAWVLGLGLACAFAILNAMWLELAADDAEGRVPERAEPPPGEEIR